MSADRETQPLSEQLGMGETWWRDTTLAAMARAEAAEAENVKLREMVEGKFDAYDQDGEPVLPRGWTVVDGGRLDELEAAEAELEAEVARLRSERDEAEEQLNRLAFLMDQPSEGWLAWAERYRAGDETLHPEAYYTLRDTTKVWLETARSLIARLDAQHTEGAT